MHVCLGCFYWAATHAISGTCILWVCLHGEQMWEEYWRKRRIHRGVGEKVQNIFFPCHNKWYMSCTVRGIAGRVWITICELLCENKVHKWHCLASQITKCDTVGYKQVICPCFQGCFWTLKCSNLWESSPVISHRSSKQWQKSSTSKKLPGQEQERQ